MIGPASTPAAVKPQRLIVLETEGWPELDRASRSAFEALLEQLRALDITLLRRSDHPWIEGLEQAIGKGRATCNAVTNWENRWYQRNLLDQFPQGLSERAKRTLASAEAMRVDDYRAALLERAAAQHRHAAVAPLADAAIMLSCPGPAPLWAGDTPGKPLAPRPTGDFVFNAPSSMLFAPAVTMPLLSVGGLPVGVQLMGQPHEDARVTALARWMLGAVKPIVTG